jgi:GT2 family glycosyltransferase
MISIEVVIPASNAAATVGSALASVAAQTFRPSRVVLAADGCTDATVAIALQYGATVIKGNFRSAGAARNAAIAATTAPWIAFLDADDSWRPTWLATASATIGGGRADLVYGGLVVVDAAARLRLRPARSVDPRNLRNELLTGPLVSMSAVVARAEALRDAGGFDPELVGCEDWDLWLRLAEQDLRFVATDGCHVEYFERPGSTTRSPRWRSTIAGFHSAALTRALARQATGPIVRREAWAFVHRAGAFRALDADARHEAVKAALAAVGLAPWDRRNLAILAAASLPSRILRPLRTARRARGVLVRPAEAGPTGGLGFEATTAARMAPDGEKFQKPERGTK